MKKLIFLSILLMLFCFDSFSQTEEIIYFKIDTIGVRLNQAGNKLEKSYTPGAVAVLNLVSKEFSILYKGQTVNYSFKIEQDTTETPNQNTVLNRSINMNAVDSNGTSCLIVIFLGTKSRLIKSLIFNKLQTSYYIGSIFSDSKADLYSF